MNTALPQRSAAGDADEPTLASLWLAVAGIPVTAQMLEWPPDLFALTDIVLARSEAFRFLLSPPADARWPPARLPRWPDAVVEAGREWSAWVADRRGDIPELLSDEWRVLEEGGEAPLEGLAEGREWRTCEALLTLHAIADEACAGLGVAAERSDGEGSVYRARGRELLARTGSLARISPKSVRVLPKIRTPPTGRASFSRYACVQGPSLQTRWHKLPARHAGTDTRSEYVNFLLLPWPLRVRESDFRALDGSVQRLDCEPFGFFEFAPSERLDLDLVERMLTAARDEVQSVDVVVLPESAIDESEIADLEAVLDRHGVIYLTAGVRQRSPQPGQLPASWVHTGVNPRLQKGGPLPTGSGERWFHIRQNKHHRWSLDESQIYQYHLGGALHPRIRWWEAIDVPRHAIQFVQVGEQITVVSLVCEDLAQNDDVAEVIRSVGPTVVITVLLDGPQLTSRWAARYASVLADDPGSAVLMLTSFGMVQRSRTRRHDVSPIIALWKDPDQGSREIPLEAGAQGVLLTACGDRATRRAADGRWPVDSGAHYFDVAVHQVRAATHGAPSSAPRPIATSLAALESDDLTILTGWAEAVAETLAHAPEGIAALLIEAGKGARWRANLGIAEPSPKLNTAIDSISQAVQAATSQDGIPTFDGLLMASQQDRPGEGRLDGLVRRVLRSTLEQLRSRQAYERDSKPPTHSIAKSR